MKIQKFNEELENKYDVAEKLSIKFFESSGNFGSEEMVWRKSYNVELIFYFMILSSDDLERLDKCKKYIPKYLEFFVSHNKESLMLTILLTKDELKILEEKLDLDKDSNKYNL